MIDEAAIVTATLAREGGWRDQVTRPDGSIDPATNKGITFTTFKRYHEEYLGWPTNEITERDLREMTDDVARMIYGIIYMEEPGFTPENIPYPALRLQLIDFGINSGPARAIRWLQRVIGLPATGTLDGPTTYRLRDLNEYHDGNRLRSLLPLVNDALVAARSYMIDQAVDQGIIRKADEEGLESRALSFFLAKP